MSALTEITREIREARAEGKPWPVEPSKLRELIGELVKHPYYLYPPYHKDSSFTLYGSPLVIIPFVNDPKFKTFKSMSVLAGKKIQFSFSNHGPVDNHFIDSAYFHTAAGCWFFFPSDGLGESRLEERFK